MRGERFVRVAAAHAGVEANRMRKGRKFGSDAKRVSVRRHATHAALASAGAQARILARTVGFAGLGLAAPHGARGRPQPVRSSNDFVLNAISPSSSHSSLFRPSSKRSIQSRFRKWGGQQKSAGGAMALAAGGGSTASRAARTASFLWRPSAARPVRCRGEVGTAGASTSERHRHIKYTKMTDALYSYMQDLQHLPECLSELSDFTRQVPGAHMQSPPEQIKLFALLIELMGARRALEIGVFTGYSALGIALALPEDGELVACERDVATLAEAEAFWARAGVGHKIRAIAGDAAKTVPILLEEAAGGGRSTFDFAFIDANKRAYGLYFDLCLDLVRPGGLIVVDNVLWYGRVVDGQDTSKITQSIREFNHALKCDARIDLTVLPVGDGVALCRVLPKP